MEVKLENVIPDVRTLDELKNVAYDKTWLATAQDTDLYYMYRGVEEKDGLRYDITIIPAVMLGAEFSKTKGHYHIGKYQEVYTVLEGTSIYLLQKKKSGSDDEIEDAIAIACQKGDVIVIPPNYGHITINPSATDKLTMANWISKDCKSDYSLFEKLQGACYYYILQPDSGQASWIKNPNYKIVPELRSEEPLKETPKDLSFLRAK